MTWHFLNKQVVDATPPPSAWFNFGPHVQKFPAIFDIKLGAELLGQSTRVDHFNEKF